MYYNFFKRPGATVIVDGQFGSTGKGVVAGILVDKYHGQFNRATSNAGPNSGHTAFLGADEGDPGTKVVSQQLPITGLVPRGSTHEVETILNAGAIIDEEILVRELQGWGGYAYGDVWVNPQAIMISKEAQQADLLTVQNISGTGKGTGPAIAQKVNRSGDVLARHWEHYKAICESNDGPVPDFEAPWDWSNDRVVVECSQGFSLGYHSAFWPHTTSRECTVGQAIADARIPPQMVQDVIMCVRTFPIRVGNAGPTGSGGHYADQHEVSWHEIGQEPELTTVTKRVRRVFTWSHTQFVHALKVNRPTVLFINFMNYLPHGSHQNFMDRIREGLTEAGLQGVHVWLGWGPLPTDVEEYGRLY